MLSRRLALGSAALVALFRKAAAQNRRDDTEANMVLLSADGQAAEVQAANDVVARIAAPDVPLRAEAARDVIDAVMRLADRLAATAAILPSVSLAYMAQSRQPANVTYATRFVCRIGVNELHILASQRVADLQDLAGQKVAVGPKGSATQATAAVWLQQGSLRIEPLYLEPEQALDAVLRGQIPAMLLLAAKPARLFFNLNLSDGVHFLAVSVPGGRPSGVFPTQILPQDYPLLSGGEAGRGQPVATLGVPLVLACYNWAPATPMSAGLARLSDLLIQRGSGLPGFDMTADVAGWQRFPPVSAWLARGGTVTDAALAGRRSPPPESIGPSRRTANTGRVAPAPDSRQTPPATGLTATEKERLFQQFLDWRRQH